MFLFFSIERTSKYHFESLFKILVRYVRLCEDADPNREELVNLLSLFLEMREPQPLHQSDAYGPLLFQTFNKIWQKALQQSYKPEPPNKGVKAPPH
jgi:hypothetical protein